MAASITINNLEEKALDRHRAEAKQRGLDAADLAGEVLNRVLTVPVVEPSSRSGDTLRTLAGTWSEAEAEEFLAAIADFERIDEDLWK
jgi:hypothetical protein